ncbi:MAG: hypothetical protein KI786_03865 [Mameliella sp.]|nr:hypothetical protein [Phaeodactylibacter sp.]NRA51989.1 hypothetical protein [Phaeodactylibacter sp.]
MVIAQIFVYAFYAYTLIGLAFGIWFVFKGISKVDAGMNGSNWKLRLLLLPGTIGLWPLMLRKYLNR